MCVCVCVPVRVHVCVRVFESEVYFNLHHVDLSHSHKIPPLHKFQLLPKKLNVRNKGCKQRNTETQFPTSNTFGQPQGYDCCLDNFTVNVNSCNKCVSIITSKCSAQCVCVRALVRAVNGERHLYLCKTVDCLLHVKWNQISFVLFKIKRNFLILKVINAEM